MSYEMYKQRISLQEYLQNWEQEDLLRAPEEERLDAYAKFMFKVDVFNRDHFTCQHKGGNWGCPYCNNVPYHNKLTVHHVKHQYKIKDKYEGDLLRKKLHNKRNGVTICDGSHQAFNRWEIGLCLTGEQLPPHFRGHTLWKHRTTKIDMKQKVKEGKLLRKQYKGVSILRMRDLPMLIILFRFLSIPYYELWGE